jgi:hypothetical protein
MLQNAKESIERKFWCQSGIAGCLLGELPEAIQIRWPSRETPAPANTTNLPSLMASKQYPIVEIEISNSQHASVFA